jgi:membrane protein implicated in regulation of membrane protease activity
MLLQIPSWVALGVLLTLVDGHWDLPAWVTPVGLAALVAKDLVLFPFLRHAYGFGGGSPAGVGRVLGARGIATDDVDGVGYVKVLGELWRAEPAEPGVSIGKGEAVRVCGIRGFTVLVRRDS